MSLDQFFTPRDTAAACWSWLQGRDEIKALDDPLWIEPSAGTGAFYDLLPLDQRVGYELDAELAERTGVGQADFLAVEDLGAASDEPVVVVGNPPFGARGAQALAFVSHAFKLGADYVAMILPGAFRPDEDGTPPGYERRIKGGYSIAHFPVPDAFELPAGSRGNKDISGCAFVLYKRGVRPATAAGPLFGEQQLAAEPEIVRGATSGCDFYVRGDLGRPEVRDGVYASVAPLPAKWSPVGVRLPAELRGKRAHLLTMNWKPYIRRTPTNFGHITKATIRKAIIEAPEEGL